MRFIVPTRVVIAPAVAVYLTNHYSLFTNHCLYEIYNLNPNQTASVLTVESCPARLPFSPPRVGVFPLREAGCGLRGFRDLLH